MYAKFDPELPEPKKGLLSGVTLKVPNKLWRALTLNSPLVGSLVGAGALGLLGWHGMPLIKKKLNALFGGNSHSVYDDDPDRDLRIAAAGALGLIGGSIPILSNYSSEKPGYGLLSYSPMESEGMTKSASVLPTMSIADASQLIHSNPLLAPEMKTNALELINSFGAPPNTQISGGNIVGQAIATGKSAAAGAAIGFTTAKVLGLDNPKSAAIFGAVANTLGLAPALATRLIF